MPKKISVWLAAILVIFAAVITFQLTIIFGGVFFREQPSGIVPPEYTTATESDGEDGEPVTDTDTDTEKTLGEQIMARINEKLPQAVDLYSKFYVGELNVDDIVDGVLYGFVAYTGDKYGAYHNVESFSSINEGYSGKFAGIGVSVIYNSEGYGIEILNVMPNSPALEADLRPGDIIVAVDGVNVASVGYDEAVSLVRGTAGTDVTVTVIRGENYDTVLDATMTRREVEEQSVTYEELDVDGIYRPVAYVRLMDFNDKTAEQFKEALIQGYQNHVHGFVVDVRNNGGGELSSILNILDMILSKGTLVRIQYSDGTEDIYEATKNTVIPQNMPIVILANGNTASAAELFVSALHDYLRASVVGTTTYGKGTVQSLIPFADGSALRLSTAMYAPPFSDNYEGIGIKPDVEVEIDEKYKYANIFKIPHEEDAQLQAALNLYK